MSLLGFLFGGDTKTSSSNTSSSTNQYRYDTMTTTNQNLGANADMVSGFGNTVDRSTNLQSWTNNTDFSNRSTNLSSWQNTQDFSNRSTNLSNWSQDNSNRSTNLSNWSQDNSNRSTINTDARDLSTSNWAFDSSNRAVTTNTSTQVTTDTGHNVTINADSERIAAINAGLLGDISDNQSDGLKALSNFGLAGQIALAEEAKSIFGDNVAAWTHTVSTADSLLEKMFTSAANQQAGAERIATQAIQSFQPVQNAIAGDMSKMLMIGAAVIGAILILK